MSCSGGSPTRSTIRSATSIAAGLLIAVQRGARTVAVLNSLAEQARHQADRRRIVDAERAPVQREVTLLSVIMGALIVGLLVFGRADYLRAYDTAAGQLFLGVDPRDLCGAARAGATPRPLPAPEPVPHRVRRRRRRPIGGGPMSPIGAILLCSFVLVGAVWLIDVRVGSNHVLGSTTRWLTSAGDRSERTANPTSDERATVCGRPRRTKRHGRTGWPGGRRRGTSRST